ncbi:MAG: 50S ribosomal protein L35 [Candidatus Omnitrophica bacterium]|nr:50S ribosomal protein L35 [Candidatus Omnitrophota bacterium]
MPKMKTRRATAKRFRVTAKGRVKRGQAFRSHLMGGRSRDRKRRLRRNDLVSPADEKNIKRLLPYA